MIPSKLSNPIALALSIISICLYAYSMFLPGIALTVTWGPNETIYGKDLLFLALFPITALVAISYAGFALLANHLFILASILNFRRNSNSSLMIYFGALILALTAVIPSTFLLDEAGGEGEISGLLIGYYIWLASIVLGLISALLKSESPDSLLVRFKRFALGDRFFPTSGALAIVISLFVLIKNLMFYTSINDRNDSYLFFYLMLVFAVYHVRQYIKFHPDNKLLSFKTIFLALLICIYYFFAFGLLYI